jgi:hypothetical protein
MQFVKVSAVETSSGAYFYTINGRKYFKICVYTENVGIFDERILVNTGGSYIMGYLIVCIGSQRIIVRKSNIKRSNFTFSINK